MTPMGDSHVHNDAYQPRNLLSPSSVYSYARFVGDIEDNDVIPAAGLTMPVPKRKVLTR